MAEVAGCQPMTPTLPVDLQDDLFNAISETGLMYDFGQEGLNFAPAGTSGGFGQADLQGLGIPDHADRSTFTDHHHPGLSDPSIGHNAAIRMQSQHHQQELLQELHARSSGHGAAETSTGGFYMQDQPMPDPMTAKAINSAAEQAAAQAAKVAADTRTRLSEAAESSQGAGGSEMEGMASPRSLDMSAQQKRKAKATPAGSTENTPRSANKGLRHFSLKVCEKVQEKGVTTYNEVADELVEEFRKNGECGSPGNQYDEKNIRRRVYDALNVLIAMEIVQKEKKEISWKGLPCMGSAGRRAMVARKANLTNDIEQKQAYLQELVEQYKTLKLLMQRNENAPLHDRCHGYLHLPFILIQTERDATVEVFISDDMHLVEMDFSKSPFQIHDDGYLLKQMMTNGHLGVPRSGGVNDGMANAAAPAQPASFTAPTSQANPPQLAPPAAQQQQRQQQQQQHQQQQQQAAMPQAANAQQSSGSGTAPDWNKMLSMLQQQMSQNSQGPPSEQSMQQVLGMIMANAGKMQANNGGNSSNGGLSAAQREALATIASQLQVLQNPSGDGR